MRLVVLAHGKSLSGRRFSPDRANPGIGGTQFTRVRLAEAFSRRFSEHQVEIVSEYPFEMALERANLQRHCAPFEEFLGQLIHDSDDWVLTGPSMLLKTFREDILKAVAPRTICTSHLMHDQDLWDAERVTAFGAVGCVGAYHFHATRCHSPKVYLRDLFLPGWEHEAVEHHTDAERSEFRIVHIGALLPLKGFDDLAQIWRDIRDAVPTASLDVIGGADLYGRANDHPFLPTTKVFGDEIMRYLSEEDLESRNVRFHGRLGSEKLGLIRQSDVAVLNVGNRQEALCAALIECLDLGTPVVGSAATGLWDTMRYFPELSTRQPNDVPPILSHLHQHRDELAALRERSQTVARHFRDENERIIERWAATMTAVLEGRTPPSFKPKPSPEPSFVSWTRWAKRRARYELRRSPAGSSSARLAQSIRMGLRK